MANTLAMPSRGGSEWTALISDAAEDLDEPPEKLPTSAFTRSTVRRPAEQPSLLTKAILAQSDEETPRHVTTTSYNSHRRRSVTSTISIASTADLTSDTGFTSPSRVSTPSPPVSNFSILRLRASVADNKVPFFNGPSMAPSAHEPVAAAPRKRCIQFACAAKPNTPAVPLTKTAAAQPVAHSQSNAEPSTPQRTSALSSTPTTVRPSPVRRLSNKGAVTRPRFLRVTSGDLIRDGSHFHEFASDIPREDDWIRDGNSNLLTKLTINDTLIKENRIRRLATEVEEEEAQLEEEEAEQAIGDHDNDNDVNDDEDDDDDDDNNNNNNNKGDEDGEAEDDDAAEDESADLDDAEADLEYEDSDGYHTDEETGFADSDSDGDDGDENMVMWTPCHATAIRTPGMPSFRRLSMNEQHSDSSAASARRLRRAKARPIGPTAEVADLPDSTDFVCGTLDEDRPLEDVFMSCLAARRSEHLRVIPQDIDPSFPASDLEEEDEEDAYVPPNHDSDQNVWPIDDLHHDQDRSRRQRNEHTSPRRLRSPPPTKRHQSPPPKVRGRSPKLLFDRHSPRRLRSPCPKAMVTPLQTPRQGMHIKFNLAGRPGLTHTKSLPRSAALFPRPKQHKSSKMISENNAHVRGAIDIVKGLEKKRQRRKEKFMQKYCDRARRGQIPERKMLIGRGVERMKEVGLIMAGKKDQGNYVLSF